MRIGGRLEALFRAAVREAARVEGREPLAMIRAVHPQADSLERVTLGTLARVLQSCSREVEDEPALGPFVVDLRRGKKSVLWRVINYRNDVAHGRRSADDAPTRAAELSLWLREHMGV